MNLWRYDLATKALKQITSFKDYDVHFPSLGPDEIVMEAGGKLYLYQIANQQLKEVKVSVAYDRAALKPSIVSVEKYIQSADISPDGKRAVICCPRRVVFATR